MATESQAGKYLATHAVLPRSWVCCSTGLSVEHTRVSVSILTLQLPQLTFWWQLIRCTIFLEPFPVSAAFTGLANISLLQRHAPLLGATPSGGVDGSFGVALWLYL